LTHVLILGANGQIARYAIDLFLNDTDVNLTLYLRNSNRLRNLESDRVHIIEGDVRDLATLEQAMEGQDVVYANVSGDMEGQAKSIVKTMNKTGLKRLIFINAFGIYNEIPGEFGRWNQRVIGQYLGPYRKAADIIENSDLDYTIIRPPWLTNKDEIDFEITDKDETFIGTVVSRKSVAALVVKLVESPDVQVPRNLGINKPNTDGDRPAF